MEWTYLVVERTLTLVPWGAIKSIKSVKGSVEASQGATTTLLPNGDSKLKAHPHPKGMVEVCATHRVVVSIKFQFNLPAGPYKN